MIPKKKEKSLQSLAATEDSGEFVSNLVTNSINTSTTIIEEKKSKSKGKGEATEKKVSSSLRNVKNKGGLTMASVVPDLAIKIYEEQIPDGVDALWERIRNMSKDDYWVWAICHDKDVVADDVFVEAYKKRHFHIYVVKRGKDKDGKSERRKVSTILNLFGIVFRPGLDDIIWKERGVERIQEIAHCVAYATHETDKAMAEGKTVYDRDEIVSNLDPEELDQLRDGYSRIVKAKNKVSLQEQAEILETCRNCGYTNSMSWEELRNSMAFILRKSSAVMKLYREAYQEGVDMRMEERTDILRLAIFIKGAPNQGKTYAAQHAFDGLGLRVFKATDGGKSGRFDSLTENHDVMILDDATIDDPLNVADNNAVKMYKRGNGNPYWCGSHFLVTSNLDFEKWAKRCGVQYDDQIEALKSRFFICHIVDEPEKGKFLDCISPSERGTKEQQLKRLEMYKAFKTRFDALISSYHPEETKIDYSEIMSGEPAAGWANSIPNNNGQYSLPDVSDCLPFG